MNEINETEKNEINETGNEINEIHGGGTPVMRMVVEVDGETCLRMERPLRTAGRMRERVPIQELAMAFTGTRAVPEPEKGIIKIVRKSGNSLTCSLTRELRKLGLEDGDGVEIILRKVGE